MDRQTDGWVRGFLIEKAYNGFILWEEKEVTELIKQTR